MMSARAGQGDVSLCICSDFLFSTLKKLVGVHREIIHYHFGLFGLLLEKDEDKMDNNGGKNARRKEYEDIDNCRFHVDKYSLYREMKIADATGHQSWSRRRKPQGFLRLVKGYRIL
ncbi:MAG: hypothetical protein ABSG49_06385 [Methanoregula sp.]|jgi:hypothetical protein|uniref:hypothetical protein n=1 Tax=Methanoregula sp. TaxID=2052170 RepID=UPI003C259D3C